MTFEILDAEFARFLTGDQILVEDRVFHTRFGRFDHLGEGKEANQDRQQLEAVTQGRFEEIRQQADLLVAIVDAHQGNEDAKEAGKDPLGHGATGERGNDGQGKEDDQEFLDRTEFDREFG